MDEPYQYECALITGASSGLGEEFARQLASVSKQLVLVARRNDRLTALGESLKEEYPELDIVYFLVDLTNEEKRGQLVSVLEKNQIYPDLLVNNAGTGDYGEFHTADWNKLDRMIRLNVVALTHLSHQFIPLMIRNGGGHMINVSSLASLVPIPDFSVYAATKAYVTSFSEALRMEVEEHGIHVTALCPGPVHTEFGAYARRPEDEGKELPMRESFYVPAEEVVRDALHGVSRNIPRVFPGVKVAVLAAALTVVPLFALRCVLKSRPRRRKFLEGESAES